MALHAAGTPAISLTGAQAGIRTSRAHRTARIVDIVPQRVLEELERGNVVVVAGFQGATEDMDVTTLGRGGSDTTAVALAVAVRADRCEIFTDVPGVHTADPRIVADARVIPTIDYDEMLELASAGARVMHPRAVEIGEAYSMEIRVRSTFDDEPGTIIAKRSPMEIRQKVRAIAHETDVAKVTLLRVPDQPGVAAAIFGPFGDVRDRRRHRAPERRSRRHHRRQLHDPRVEPAQSSPHARVGGEERAGAGMPRHRRGRQGHRHRQRPQGHPRRLREDLPRAPLRRTSTSR